MAGAMKSTEQINLEASRRVFILRNESQLNGSTGASQHSRAGTQPIPAVPPATKKTLNIPIGDVTADVDYCRDVTPTYQVPGHYVKYLKKVGDEADPSTEYILDHDDEVWLKGVSAPGLSKETIKLLTPDALETIFNILERYTGTSKDPIPQFNATKVVQDELRWTDLAVSKLLPIVYNYWLLKRSQLGKPLCRKYWPQLTSSDTNPRQVFRARDKERYKLRKQQKRNDIDAFRKMQQLRKEFATARNLLHLVLERELLTEAEFDCQREIFELRAAELGIAIPGAESSSGEAAGEGVQERPAFRYTLRFEDLVYPPHERMLREAEERAAQLAREAEMAVEGSELGGAESAQQSRRQGENKRRKRDRERTSAGGEAAEAPLVVFAYDSSGNLVPTTAPPTAAPAGTARSSSNRGGRSGAGRSSTGPTATSYDPTMTSAEIFAALLVEHQLGAQDEAAALAALSALPPELRVVPAELDGPAEICQPQWASFMEATPRFEQQRLTAADYLTDLEYRRDARDGSCLVPTGYRTRCRISRGGRMMLDRIPMYDADDEDGGEEDGPSTDAVYIYPTSLPYQYPESAFSILYPPAVPPLLTAGNRPGVPGAFAAPVASSVGAAASGATSATQSSAAGQVGSVGVASMGIKEEPMPESEGPHHSTPAVKSAPTLPELPLSNARHYFGVLRGRPQPGQAEGTTVGATTLGAGPPSFNAAVTVQQRQRLARMPKMPPFEPTAGVPLPPYKAARLAAILAASDSEDERPHFPKYKRGEDFERNVTTKTNTSNGEQIKFRFSTHLR